MANFGLSDFALRSVCPTNCLILDTAADGNALPGVYVQIPSMKLNELLANGDGSVHPAFLVNGVERKLKIGKFQGVAHNNRIYSLPGEDPRTNIALDAYEQYCKNKGPGHHCITAAEWAFLALWCKKNNCQPYGNNNYGKDSRETAYLAIPTTKDGDGHTNRIATGSGPITWSHNKQVDGIWDLNGNVYEWIAGIRLCKGELQVIPYNNAAAPDTDTSATSTEWKTVNGNATSYNDLYLTPNGNGTTSNSVKLDYVSSHWQWSKSITSQENTARSAEFKSTTCSGLSAFAKLYLQAMALTPEDDDTNYEGDYFWGNNGEEERCVYRGGYWDYGVQGGVFSLNFYNPRSYSSTNRGGRPAFYD